MLTQRPPTPALAHLDIDNLGFAWLPQDDFVGHFAADVDPARARVMFAVQQSLAASTLQDEQGDGEVIESMPVMLDDHDRQYP